MVSGMPSAPDQRPSESPAEPPSEPYPSEPYPPEPWALRGQLRVAVFLVPLRDLPPVPPELAPAVRVVRLGRRAVVGAAWVVYEPGGVLAYRELLSSVLMRDGLRPRVTITDIWVDSVASRDGGRALWGIPKDLARFDFTGEHLSAELDTGPLAEATVRRGVRLPGRWPIGFRVTQSLHGRPKTSRVRATARLCLGRSQWTVPAGGPLRYLAGRRPLLTATAADFRMAFGAS
jgi:Acetoacetate decarboxylase (ADC)